MRKLNCIVLACVLVFFISGCGRTEGQGPISGDVSDDGPASVSAQDEDNGNMEPGEGEMAEDGNPFDFETKTVMLNSGYEMPIYGIGTYSLTGQVCVESVTAALDRGVRLIDTAYMYHNDVICCEV